MRYFPGRFAVVRVMAYLWAAPNTALGLALLLPIVLAGGKCRIVAGVCEGHGRVADWMLGRCRLFRCAQAVTLGHVVIGRNAVMLEALRPHERVHVRQYERWGPLFLPAYFLAGAALALRGRNAYLDNPFEREAYRQAPRRAPASGRG